jgi:Flavin containing amine oxidoreductase
MTWFVDEPLFSGIVGAWQHRPRPKSELQGLYFCGDYCQSHVDVISVESAVTTGLNAAAALIDDRGLENHIVVQQPFVYPRWKLVLLKYLLVPVAIACRFWVWFCQWLKTTR